MGVILALPLPFPITLGVAVSLTVRDAISLGTALGEADRRVSVWMGPSRVCLEDEAIDEGRALRVRTVGDGAGGSAAFLGDILALGLVPRYKNERIAEDV